MFEKEAEEYRKEKLEERKDKFVFELPEVYVADIPQAFKDGAEFGYNKGYHDAEEHYMNVIDSQHKLVEESKANEWHYVKDGKPKDNEYVLIYTDLKNTYVARIPTEKDYFITRRGGFVQMSAVIAWKEIVLPELKESE